MMPPAKTDRKKVIDARKTFRETVMFPKKLAAKAKNDTMVVSHYVNPPPALGLTAVQKHNAFAMFNEQRQ
jgi:glutaredoxin